jgi:hypothetical protein
MDMAGKLIEAILILLIEKGKGLELNTAGFSITPNSPILIRIY